MDNKPKAAVVTGAGAGIGKAIALCLAKAGYTIVVVDIDADRADWVAQKIRQASLAAEALVCDVGDRAQVFQMMAQAVQAAGQIDVLVNNAGIIHLGPLVDISENHWRESFRVNVDGVLFCCQAVLPAMQKRQQGNIINIASWNGKLGAPNFSAYSATKAAVISITQSLAREVASSGIRVNAVCPGIIADTPMRERVQTEGQAFGLPPAAERAKTIPMGCLGKPDDIAKTVLFLASENAAYMTGQAINVTGGLWLH